MHSEFTSLLQEFITLKTVAGNKEENQLAINWISNQLENLGFSISIKNQNTCEQPVIVASLGDTNLPETVVLYNHYDVEAIHSKESWNTPPFELTEHNDRWFARGIADNKAVLLARLFVIKQRIQKKEKLPSILWLIQGEEEIGAPQAHALFPNLLQNTKACVFLEETGYYRDETPLIFYQSNTPQSKLLAESLNDTIFDGKGKVENRFLKKFGPCPLIENLPSGYHYIGFGPNDYNARIHSDNESMSIELLNNYHKQFDTFLTWFMENTAHFSKHR